MLVAVPSSRLLGRMFGETDLLQQLRDRGYHVLHVKQVRFMLTRLKSIGAILHYLPEWGADPDRKLLSFTILF